jgi:hypothetical protein
MVCNIYYDYFGGNMAQAKLHCSYQHSLNTKVHIFSFDVPDKQSVEEFIVHLGKAIETLQEQETLTMIVDLRPAGIPPFNYAIQSVRRYFSHRHPPQNSGCLSLR